MTTSGRSIVNRAARSRIERRFTEAALSMQHIGPKYDPRYPPFKEIESGHSEELIFQNAKKIIDRIDIDAAALDFLYHHSEKKCLSRNDWEHEVRMAHAIDRILRTYFPKIRFSKPVLPQVIKKGLAANLFDAPDLRQGALILTFHGGFTLVARMLFAAIKGGTQMTGGDHRGRLFSALRTLQSGQCVMLAPDGIHGRLVAKLNVLGHEFPAGDGAAYLAYESKCPTMWYTVKRHQESFLPILDSGPRREEDEGFDEFKKRLFHFYSAKIEEFVTDGPCSLVLSSRWTNEFGRQLPS